jgi:UDP-N-acetylglucosamine 2-epimerase (non-hydrolysing)
MLERRPAVVPRKPYLLVTLHRRESFGDVLRGILGAVSGLLAAEPDATVLWPVHPNPRVASLAWEIFGGEPRVELCAPLDYDVFVTTLAHARAVLSDSGGIQEEAPSLGKRVLVARDTTERPEAIATGHNRLVGRDPARIRDALVAAWHEPPYHGPLPAPNPYGDGTAGARIARILAEELRLGK